jgi:hypothetical protein
MEALEDLFQKYPHKSRNFYPRVSGAIDSSSPLVLICWWFLVTKIRFYPSAVVDNVNPATRFWERSRRGRQVWLYTLSIRSPKKIDNSIDTQVTASRSVGRILGVSPEKAQNQAYNHYLSINGKRNFWPLDRSRPIRPNMFRPKDREHQNLRIDRAKNQTSEIIR